MVFFSLSLILPTGNNGVIVSFDEENALMGKIFFEHATYIEFEIDFTNFALLSVSVMLRGS